MNISEIVQAVQEALWNSNLLNRNSTISMIIPAERDTNEEEEI